jgi:hypothetical protein
VAPWAGTTVFAHIGSRILAGGGFLVGLVATVIMLQVTADEPARAVIEPHPVDAS